MKSVVAILLALAASQVAVAQGVPGLEPFPFTGDLYVADAGNDVILRLQDLNLDRDYNDAGEVVVFYDGSTGFYPLSNPTGLAVGPDGTLYVVDSTQRQVLALLDLDLDGTAQGALEHRLFFDGNPLNNASGIDMTSPQDVTVDAAGTLWVATANTSTGADAILRLQDLGGGFGALDAGEAIRYFAPPPSPAGASIPADVKIGPDGAVYYLENGNTVQKGIWRLHDDVIPNGHCNDPGEATLYWVPSTLPGSATFWGFVIDAAGAFYLADSGNDVIWRGLDLDSSTTIIAGTSEETLWWNPGAASLVWMIDGASDGSLFAAESQAPDRVLRIADDVLVNGTANDPGETSAVYDMSIASVVIANPRALAFARKPTLYVPITIAIGSPVTIGMQGTAGHPFSVWFSTSAANLPIPPYGVLGISLFPPDLFGELFAGFLSTAGTEIATFFIPNDPSIVNASLHVQGYVTSVVRAEFSNPVTVTFTL